MKVFVAGATGVAGRRAVAQLLAAGHDVTAVGRGSAKTALLRGLGAKAVHVDLFDPGDVTRAVGGHDAIVNLATKIPSVERALLPGAWKENDKIRREVSRNLVDAALALQVQRYVQESLGFVYADGDDDWLDEDAPLDVPPHALSVLDAEEQAHRFTQAGRTGVVLRFGQFYAPDAAHTRTMIQTARRGLAPFVGPDQGFVPLIHADDVAAAVVAALDLREGTYNVVDDEPTRRGELNEAIRGAIGGRRLRSIPDRAAALGGKKVRMLMRSQRVSNRRFRSATRWNPAFSNAREGLAQVVRDVNADG